MFQGHSAHLLLINKGYAREEPPFIPYPHSQSQQTPQMRPESGTTKPFSPLPSAHAPMPAARATEYTAQAHTSWAVFSLRLGRIGKLFGPHSTPSEKCQYISLDYIELLAPQF